MVSVLLRVFLFLTLLTGVLYPLVVTLVSQVFWHHAANGSFLAVKERIVGSRYIGQQFVDKKYFWPRPSSIDYLPMPSGGSNLGPTNPLLQKQVKERAAKLIEAHLGSSLATIPRDLLYASGSGIDPDISLEAALFQVDRVMKARGLDVKEKGKLVSIIDKISKSSLDRYFGVHYVNVLELNIALDGMKW